MATGDLEGNLQKLRRELARIRFPRPVSDTELRLGHPSLVLQILGYVLSSAFQYKDQRLAAKGWELKGKRDASFLRSAFTLLREEYAISPCLSTDQFLKEGFAERKVLLLLEVIQRCRECHAEAARRLKMRRKRTARDFHSVLGECKMHIRQSPSPAHCRTSEDEGRMPQAAIGSKITSQASNSRSQTSYHKATLLSRIQLHVAEIEREMASTKAEVLGSCATTCDWGAMKLGNRTQHKAPTNHFSYMLTHLIKVFLSRARELAVRALEQRVSCLESYHGIPRPADSARASVSSSPYIQTKRDPEKSAAEYDSHVGEIWANHTSQNGTLSGKTQCKVSGAPDLSRLKTYSPAEAARRPSDPVSTMELIQSLQKRNREVLSYLHASQIPA